MLTFAVSCQYAHYDHSESEDRGTMSSAEVLRVFDEFDWPGQAAEAEKLDKCAPTLSVSVPSTESLIWVSVCREGTSLAFVSECRLAEARTTLDTQTFKPADARKALELFTEGEHVKLRALYAEAP